MMGAREAINGALLYTARDENESDGGRRLVSVVKGRAYEHVKSNIVIEVLVGPSGSDFWRIQRIFAVSSTGLLWERLERP